MQWFTCILKPVLQKYVRMQIGHIAFGEQKPTNQQKEEVWNEISQLILPKMEQHLKEKGRTFFCSEEDLTIIDVQYYNAIQQLTQMDKNRNISQGDFPELHSWINNIN